MIAIRTATPSMIIASVVLLVACKLAPAPEPAPSELAPAPAPVSVIEPELYEIPITGDGRTVPIALAETDEGIELFVTEPEGIGRYALDLDAHTAVRSEVLPIDRYTNVAAYDRAHARLWWATALDRVRIPGTSSGGFQSGDLELTHSSTVEHSAGLRETIRVCPASVGTLGEVVMCDHQIRTLLPAYDGVLLGGQLAEQVGHRSAVSWIGFADASGKLTAEHRLEGMGQTWVGALAVSDAGVLAVAWSESGGAARASFLLFGGPTLELRNNALRSTPTWLSSPWSAAVAAPDGGFWVVLPIHRHELMIVSIARDGSIAAEHVIEGAALPISSVQAFGLRSGEPWLLITDLYEEPLWAGRIDPASGAVPERHEIPLPLEFATERMLMLDQGLVLAGRVNLERPLAVWIPLP